jgi:hypothetical protein
MAETMAPGEIRRRLKVRSSVNAVFPLDTANALRGRLRREHFTIFKKGSKGVSYVCAVKRNSASQVRRSRTASVALISYIENNPMVRASELAPKFLGISVVPPTRPADVAATGSEAAAPTPAARAEFDHRRAREDFASARRPHVARA